MQSITSVRADKPSVLKIDVKDALIVTEIRHGSPSSSHYIEKIEVKISDNLYEVTLDPQSEVIFETEIVLEDLNLAAFEIRVRCTLHGWSNWKAYGEEAPTEEGGGIPGFPGISVLIGLTILGFTIRARKY